MYEVTVQDTFSSGHYLRDYYGKCENPHGQNYRVLMTLIGEHLEPNGLLLDFKLLKRLLQPTIQYLDHNTAFSTISVNIIEAGAPAAVQQPDSWGFVTALSDAAHNFVTTINYMVSGLGAIGPIVIVLGIGYLLWRRRGSPGLKRA